MFEASFVIDLIKALGFPALIFFMWLMDHRSKESHLNRLINMLQDQVDQQKELVESVQYQGAVLGRVEEKIITNQFCPMIREELRTK